MNAKLALFGTILGLQTAWILGTSFVQERTLAQGQVVLLETRPVDPRDLLRGDYVTLGYSISTLPLSLFYPPLSEVPKAGQTVYVALEFRGDFYEAATASTEPIFQHGNQEPQGGRVVIKGIASRSWTAETVRVVYGLEKYFVPEGTGNPTGKVTVRAAVPKSGNATIKEVLVDGKPYSQVMKDQISR
ncbi:MAG: GDYXXLXY domain-containing protein [Verrucomicrobiota bacterium]|jgi:uncharacterized membrane-anchored protein|nr:GDYXXLXY domain-containing protein [Verrucomicrobiota bacterium]